jgi:hypothetical protein
MFFFPPPGGERPSVFVRWEIPEQEKCAECRGYLVPSYGDSRQALTWRRFAVFLMRNRGPLCVLIRSLLCPSCLRGQGAAFMMKVVVDRVQELVSPSCHAERAEELFKGGGLPPLRGGMALEDRTLRSQRQE